MIGDDKQWQQQGVPSPLERQHRRLQQAHSRSLSACAAQHLIRLRAARLQQRGKMCACAVSEQVSKLANCTSRVHLQIGNQTNTHAPAAEGVAPAHAGQAQHWHLALVQQQLPALRSIVCWSTLAVKLQLGSL